MISLRQLELAGFRCLSCENRPALTCLPFCRACRPRLIDCPPLCPVCHRADCPGLKNRNDCERPWRHLAGIESLHARYLLVGRTHRVLRLWKFHGGPLIDRFVLIPDTLTRGFLHESGAEAIVPVPQAAARIRRMGRSSSREVAEWLGSLTGLPVLPLLRTTADARTRQAGRRLAERLANPRRFALSRGGIPANLRRVILVDDFVTSGRTLEGATRALHEAGVKETRAYCLGLRPPFEPATTAHSSAAHRTAPSPGA